MDKDLIGTIASVISLMGFMTYMVAIVWKGMRPNPTTWFILGFVNLITLANYATPETRSTTLMLGTYAACQITIGIMAFWKQTTKSDNPNRDSLCLLGAFISLGIRLVAHNALAGLMLALATNFIGLFPTINRLAARRGTESRLAWGLFMIGSLVNMFTVREWTFFNASQPTYFLACNVLIVGLAFRSTNKAPQ